ncbi:MAG: hypothetical protein IIX02_00375 [Clostridia bacterium]|nr:hypothetical protein [Clostridia bacterium]
MDKKKLTDEEIVEILKKRIENINPWETNALEYHKGLFDLIHRLQDEVQRLATLEMEHIGMIADQKAEIERLTEEVKKIKEMTAEQVVESEKLKQSCLEAVNSFIRMETLYKVKCQELEIANKKLEELKSGKID